MFVNRVGHQACLTCRLVDVRKQFRLFVMMIHRDAVDPSQAITAKFSLICGLLQAWGLLVDVVKAADEGFTAQSHTGSFNGRWVILEKGSISGCVGDKDGLIRAITADEGVVPNVITHPLLRNERAFIENFVIYEAYKASDPANPIDESYVYTNMVSFQPTSRGLDSSLAPYIDSETPPDEFARGVLSQRH
ncbi:hypothetical protein SLS53_001891 [Cytospora paraplurivora]|uniref:Uncharacterized protein n=1 Tax=Cytospora paraplurivora TaxID=2898453 RepID=A0AAN9YL28_9PEZI